MDKYFITRSTATMNLQILELIDMLMYSQSGTNGYWGILQN